jgi:phosphoglycerate dehydrogenase-like enzyme
MREVIAAVTGRAHQAVLDGAPEGVDVRLLPDGLDAAVFVIAGGEPELTDALPRLESLAVVQTLSAGTDWIEPIVPRWATLCSAVGSRDVPVAEWVLAALLAAPARLLDAVRSPVWEERQPVELHGQTVLIVGHGSIGRAVEARLAPFGARVVGVASRARDGVHAVDELPELIHAADAVVVLAPLSDATRGLVGADLLGRMRDGALLINAGRGPVVDTDALVAELERGRLRAILDVTDPEPLPAGHPLWDLADAITPHHAGDSPQADERAVLFAVEQLGRFVRGEPLLNVVRDKGV